MKDGTDIERDPDRRCKATDVEKPKRTHLCRLGDRHPDEHKCICGRKWEPKA